MARLSKVLLGVWLAGMFASGSAFATLVPLGDITPGASSFTLLGLPAAPGVAFDDQFAFNVIGSDGWFAASVITQELLANGDSSLFDITAQLFGWDSTTSTFIALTGLNLPNPAVLLPETNLVLAQASGGDASPGGINFAYYLEVKGTPTAGGSLAGYGGSLNILAVPEPSSLLLLLG